MKQTYKEYLEESTDVVRSNEKKSKLMLVLVTLGIWALSLIAFGLVHTNVDSRGYMAAVTWAVLPVTFFVSAFLIGHRDWFGKLKWLAAPLFGLMYAMSGYTAYITTEDAIMKTVVWPDFVKLPIGILIALAGICAGIWFRNRTARQEAQN